MPEQITESIGTILEASPGSGGSRYKVLVISEGQGSSGLYPKETLQEAARNKVIRKGTQSYIDHQGTTEERDRARVGRSLRDLAGVLTEDAYWDDAHNGLVAEMRVYGPYRDLIAEVHKDIGLSIKGLGSMTVGEGGQRVISELTEVSSVDWVTRAGRGGRVLQLLESAREPLTEARNVGQWVESRLHQDFTNRADEMAANGQLTREERIALSSAIGDALAVFVASLEASSPQLYQRDIWDEPTAPTVAEARPNVPVDPAEANPTTTASEESLMPQIEEGRLAQLEEAAGRVTEAEARATAAEARVAALEARQAARPRVAAKVAESEKLAGRARTQARLVESIVAALPVVDGQVADDALTAAVEAAVKEAEAELAEGQAPARPALFGVFGSLAESAAGEPADLSESEFKQALGAPFGRKVSA